MANYNPSDLIEQPSGAIPNGQLAPVMRRSMENKNLLEQRGSLYVGTGNKYETLDDEGENVFSTAITSALPPPTNDRLVLGADMSNSNNKIGLAWKGVSQLLDFATIPVVNNATSWNTSSSGIATYEKIITPVEYGFSARSNIFTQLMLLNEGLYTVCGSTVAVDATSGNVTVYSNVMWTGTILLLGL